MVSVGVYDQVKKALQDIIAPELSAMRGEIQRLDGRAHRRVDRELRTAIDIRERLAALEARHPA